MSTKKLTLNEAFSQLEKLVSEFESGDVQLEESVEKFKQGLELAAQLKKQLSVLENEITTIKQQYDRLQKDEVSSDAE